MSRERWDAPHSGVRLLPGADANAYATRVSAALLAAGDYALATGWTGLFLWGVLTRPLPIVTLVIPWERGRRRLHAVRTVRSRTLIEDDYRAISGLAVASVERSFLDAARTDGRQRLRALLIDARQRRIVEPGDVACRALLHPFAPGAQRLLAAVHDVTTLGADSPFTDLVHRRLLDAGFRPDAQPAKVTTPSGRVLHPDITFAQARVCIECDSLGHHGTQRGLDLDHRKDQGYRQAGWNCLRIGWHRNDNDWPGFERDLGSALSSSCGG